MRTVVLALIVGLCAMAWLVAGKPLTQPGFTDKDITTAKESIRTEYSKQKGVRVTDVVLLRKSANELSGYVKLAVEGTDLMKECSATLDADAGNYFWKCK